MSQPFKVFFMLKRKDGVSEEEFRRHWEKEHAPKLVPLMKKYGVLYYSQVI
jgi:hypothetical protein